MNWRPFNPTQQDKIADHAHWLAQRQFSPKHVFLSIIDFCWQNKIELPTYNALALIITNSYNQCERVLINILASKLTQYHRKKLDKMIGLNNLNDKKRMQRPPITLIKQINQSLRPSDIQENVEAFKIFQEYYDEFRPLIEELKLSDQATEYFATWVQKSSVSQLNQFPNMNKLYLHLLYYIKHQLYFRHDVLIDIFLKSVRAATNSANKKLNSVEKETRSERNMAIKKLSASNKSSRELIGEITKTVKSPILTALGKISKIEELVDNYNTINNEIEKNKIIQLEESLNVISDHQSLFDALESMSLKLQRRVSDIVKVLEFNPNTSSASLISAINHFKCSNGEMNSDSPVNFLNEKENEALCPNGKFRISLYKILLFSHMEDSIKSGNLNLLYSYRYKAIHEYLIDENLWKSERKYLLEGAGLSDFIDINKVINKLKAQVDNKYKIVNERFINGENNYLSIDEHGKIKISTPKIDSDESEYISSLLSQSGFVPILQVLIDINLITDYSSSFKHFSIKHKKMNPQPKIILAGILGKGCNIGINRIANISVGITEDSLKNVVNWCFTLKNIQTANNKIIGVINKLFLANNYRHDKTQLHTGSDGQKVNVAVDSLLANFSFKYFGKGKGVTIYTFVDERQLLFHSTVISSSEREAAYVIDGLLQNEVLKSSIHSTDTHCFTLDNQVFYSQPIAN